MSRKLVLILAAAALVVVSVSTLVIFSLLKDEPIYTPFPEKLEYRIELREGEEKRVVQYYPDGLTPMYAVVEHNDGRLSEFWYWENGNRKEAKTQSAETDGKRQVLRHALIEPDGVTYKFDVEYFADGVKSKETRLVSDDTTSRNYFHPGTGNLHKAQTLTLVDQGWVLTAEKTFYNEGPLESEFVRLEDGSTKRDLFTQDGKFAAVQTMDRYSSNYVETAFFDDEKTPRRIVEQNRKNTYLTLKRPDGTDSVKITWAGPVGQGVMIYDEFAADGKSKSFHQYYLYKDGKYHLWSFNLFNEDGSDLRSVWLGDDSKIPESETVYDPDNSKNWVWKSYDENGFLKLTREFKNKQKVAETTYTPEDNLRPHPVLEEYVQFPAFESPPQVIPYNPPKGPHG